MFSPSDFVTIGLLIALEGLLSADNAMVLAVLVLGLPTDLSPAMPGFIARSESNTGGVYVFAPEVTLEGGKQYWFYTDTQGSFASSFDTDLYSGGDLYVTGINSFPFHKASASGRMVGNTYVPPSAGVFLDANFKLQGRQKGASQ